MNLFKFFLQGISVVVRSWTELWSNIVQLIGFSSLITMSWTNIETLLLSDQQVKSSSATNGKKNLDISKYVLIKTYSCFAFFYTNTLMQREKLTSRE